jgi:DNA-binding SARP family transcriptional activator
MGVYSLGRSQRVIGERKMHLHLSLLGPFDVTLEGRPAFFATDRARALLAYLAVETGRPHRREALAGLLWPDRPEQAARRNLSQSLVRLRRAIDDRQTGTSCLRITPKTIEFLPTGASVDVLAFEDLLNACAAHRHPPQEVCAGCAGRLEEATALYRGEFLQGLSLDDSDLFEGWLVVTREHLRRQVLEALYALGCYHQAHGAYARAVACAQQQVAIEPWREEAHRQLMCALAAEGQRSTALAQYHTCCQLLAAELQAEPAAETVALYEAIRDGTLASVATEPTPLVPTLQAPTPPAPLPAAPFVGRERELARLDEFLGEALAGRGQVALIRGEVGSGKTALAREFARRAGEAHPGLVSIAGRCDAHTGLSDPYLPFREALSLLTGGVEAPWAAGMITAENAARLLALTPLSLAALASRGPDLIGRFVPAADLLSRAAALPPGQTAPTGWRGDLAQQPAQREPGWDGAGLPVSLFEQYAAVLEAVAARQPLLLVVDDLHWADASSLSLLFYLGRRIGRSRILLLGTYSPEEMAAGREGVSRPLPAMVGELKRAFGEIEIDLDRATGDDGRRFVDALLDAEPNRLDGTFRHTLLARTGGQALFTTELLREMKDRGDLRLDAEGRWVAGPALDWEHLPARVEGVIERRLGRLPAGLQAALRVACVEGEEFTAEVVARVQGTGEQQLIHRLSAEGVRRHRLLSAPSLEWLGSQPLSRYRFRHPLVREYLYRTLDEAERVYLHGAVGRALAALYGDQANRIAAQLAHHRKAAGAP